MILIPLPFLLVQYIIRMISINNYNFVFGTNNKITIENVKPLICDDIIIRKVIEKYNKPTGFPIRETYSEIKLLISQYNVNKKIHIIIGKGISTKPH